MKTKVKNKNVSVSDSKTIRSYNPVLVSLAAITFMASTDSASSRRIVSNPNSSEITEVIKSSSATRFNNQERYSLDKLKMNRMKLQSLNNLKFNWNGYQGEPINNEVIQLVDEIIKELEYQPNIFPTGRGSVQVEYYINEDKQLEIEISPDEIFMYEINNGIEEEKNITSKEVFKVINNFYA